MYRFRKLCGRACGNSFSNVGGCKVQTGTELNQGDLIEKLKENNLAKVSFLKLLTMENLLECFH